MARKKTTVDRVGPWTDIKHEILRRYCEKYSLILKRNPYLHPEYIEGFAGSGLVERQSTGVLDFGSALIAMNIQPGFDHYHFVELDNTKSNMLRKAISKFHPNKSHSIYPGDCNEILTNDVFPKFTRRNKKRGFCLLDPYGLHLDWKVIQAAGSYQTLEVMINFPAMDIEMNAYRKRSESIPSEQSERFTRFWGDDSWLSFGYTDSTNLFGDLEKIGMTSLVRAFCERLKTSAGFKFVATPGVFKNSKGGTLYYMVFATNNETGYTIGDYVLKKFV